MATVNQEEHIYHHNDETPRIAIKLEKNSRGTNSEISVSNCKSVHEAMAILREAKTALAAEIQSDQPIGTLIANKNTKQQSEELPF